MLLKSLLKTSGVGTPLFSAVAAPFATDDGAWYIMSPLYTYTDRAGTTPVSANDDFLGYIGDQSGNAYDLVAVSDAGRALAKTDGTNWWFQLDKVDDNYSTTFASPIVGTMLIGTRKGTIHLEVDIPAGAWSLMPNAAYFPGNTVTDIVLKDGYMTTAELANAKAWLASRGSPVVYTPTGTDLSSAFRTWGVLTSVAKGAELSGINSDMAFAYQTNKITSLQAGVFDTAVNATSMARMFFNCTVLTDVPSGVFDNQTVCTNYALCFSITNLTQQSIDNVLASIRVSYAANGLTGGTFDQSGGSAPSATGKADIDYLRAQGMTVTVTGGY